MSPRPMRKYKAEPIYCATCGKPIDLGEPKRFDDGQIRHAVNCLAPLRRRPKT